MSFDFLLPIYSTSTRGDSFHRRRASEQASRRRSRSAFKRSSTPRRRNPAPLERVSQNARNAIQRNQSAQHTQRVNPAQQHGEDSDRGRNPDRQHEKTAEHRTGQRKKQQTCPAVCRRPAETGEPTNNHINQNSMPD